MSSFYDNKPLSAECKWVCIYPIFINAKRTLSQGRRIARTKEIYDILKNVGLNVKLEKKMHPLDANRDGNFQGRVRVQLRNNDNSPFDSRFPSRDSLLEYAAETIPKLKSRQQKSQLGSIESDQTVKISSKKNKRR